MVRVSLPHGDSQWRLFDIVADPGETKDLSSDEPVLFEELLEEYQRYSSKVGVIELSADAYAAKQLRKTLAKKVVNKYWPYIVYRVISIDINRIGILVSQSANPKEICTDLIKRY